MGDFLTEVNPAREVFWTCARAGSWSGELAVGDRLVARGTATPDAYGRAKEVALRAPLLSQIVGLARGAGIDGDGPPWPASGQARRLEGGLVAPAVGGLAALAAASIGVVESLWHQQA